MHRKNTCIVVDGEPFSRNFAWSHWKLYFLDFFRYNFPPEVDNDVISGVAIDYVGMDICVKSQSRNLSRNVVKLAGGKFHQSIPPMTFQ